MRIRQSHPIRDRIKLILFLLFLLFVLGKLAIMVYENRQVTQKSTIGTLLKTALEPVGITMYIWGGGWNGEDNGSGVSSTRLGVNPKWEEFAKRQDEDYDFNNYRYKREIGLDCSGFVGWVLYNTFETKEEQTGYVVSSTDMAESLAKRGWGQLIKNPKNFLPGDIVSMEGHVWICLGTCEDSSVLFVHSSPPGVSVCGTLSMQQFKNAQEDFVQQSKAVLLATEYMSKYHPRWQKLYPNREVGLAYLENVILFRWNKSVMLDAKEMQQKTAEEILEILSPDM